MSQVFRGVHALHPALQSAKAGKAVPGDLSGTVAPDLHNLGGHSAQSPYTSCSHSRKVAQNHALGQGPGGVVLKVDAGPPPAGAGWRWEWSPDVWAEQEVLLYGFRSGLKVTPP